MARTVLAIAFEPVLRPRSFAIVRLARSLLRPPHDGSS